MAAPHRTAESREMQFVIERPCPQAHAYYAPPDGLFPYCVWVRWPAESPREYRDCDATMLYRVVKEAYPSLQQHFRMKSPAWNWMVCEHMGSIIE